MKILLLFPILCYALWANEAEAIIKKLDENFRGKSVHMTMNMSIKSLRHERSMKMESYSIGDEKSFLKVLYPPKAHRQDSAVDDAAKLDGKRSEQR